MFIILYSNKVLLTATKIPALCTNKPKNHHLGVYWVGGSEKIVVLRKHAADFLQTLALWKLPLQHVLLVKHSTAETQLDAKMPRG